jgi:hypothetical protein
MSGDLCRRYLGLVMMRAPLCYCSTAWGDGKSAREASHPHQERTGKNEREIIVRARQTTVRETPAIETIRLERS